MDDEIMYIPNDDKQNKISHCPFENLTKKTTLYKTLGTSLIYSLIALSFLIIIF